MTAKPIVLSPLLHHVLECHRLSHGPYWTGPWLLDWLLRRAWYNAVRLGLAPSPTS